MKKNRLITSVAAFVALTTVYATAYVAVSHNALNRGPSINAEFQKHSAEEMKAAERATMEAAGHEFPDRIRKAPDGTLLPAIVASVFDYSNATIGMYRLPEVSGGEMEKVSDVSSYYGGALKGNLFYACHDGRYADYWDTDNDPHGHKLQAYDITTWEKQGPELYLDPYRAFDLADFLFRDFGYPFQNLRFRLFDVLHRFLQFNQLFPQLVTLGNGDVALQRNFVHVGLFRQLFGIDPFHLGGNLLDLVFHQRRLLLILPEVEFRSFGIVQRLDHVGNVALQGDKVAHQVDIGITGGDQLVVLLDDDHVRTVIHMIIVKAPDADEHDQKQENHLHFGRNRKHLRPAVAPKDDLLGGEKGFFGGILHRFGN